MNDQPAGDVDTKETSAGLSNLPPTTVQPAPAPARRRASRYTHDLSLAVVGNSNIAAVIDRNARISWCCFPRLDSDTIFCGLLDQTADPYDGNFVVELENLVEAQQSYRRNTAIVSTVLTDAAGNRIEVIDFAPRYRDYGRIMRPSMLVRQIRVLAGSPRIRIVVRPKAALGEGTLTRRTGSHHVSYHDGDLSFRIVTTAPVSYVAEEVPFVMNGSVDLILGIDEPLAKPVSETVRELFERTEHYWFEWSRNLSIPFEWQDVVIRAAITLKLCAFEDTGAIVAALTTSIPESANSGRNWDYRYCWLRDAYFVVNALNQLGATTMMEEFIAFITNVAALSDNRVLVPLYPIVPGRRVDERTVPGLTGYRGMGPVRVGNKAVEQEQNDVYGSAILAATQMFFDERLSRPGDRALFERLERLGEVAVRVAFEPDASLWEFRGHTAVHTYTCAMCWAACDRLSAIAEKLGLPERAKYWAECGRPIRERVLAEAWDADRNSFVDSLGGKHLDASLLLLADLGFVAADDPKYIGTVEAVGRELLRGSHVMRYSKEDDLGAPASAFTVCTFWYIDALGAIGKADQARELFESALRCRNHVGLLSEDLDPRTGELWGNFPQSYSMVGMINSAMRLSKPWNNVFMRTR